MKKTLTDVAGRSSVAAASAVAVEGVPRLGAPPTVLTVAWRAPERQTEADRDSLSGRKVSQGDNLRPPSRCLGVNADGERTGKTKGERLKRNLSQASFSCQVGHRRLLSGGNPFGKSC